MSHICSYKKRRLVLKIGRFGVWVVVDGLGGA